MKKRNHRKIKLAIIIIASSLLVSLFIQNLYEQLRTGPEGEYITLQEARNLTWLLADTAVVEVPFPDVMNKEEMLEEGTQETLLTAAQFKQIIAGFENVSYEIPDDYRDKDFILLSDFYMFYDAARNIYDRLGEIKDTRITVLGIGEDVTDPEGSVLNEKELVTRDSVFSFRTDRAAKCLYKDITAVEREGIIYAVRTIDSREITLSNMWIMGMKQEGLLCFWNDFEICIRITEDQKEKLDTLNEKIADVSFREGALAEIHVKNDKISGKLLKVTEEGIELEGKKPYGKELIPLSEDFAAYRIYGELKKYTINDLRIGYDFTDFIIENGEIQAALIVKEENMEYIRVLIKTSDFAGALHDEVKISADCDINIITGTDRESQKTITLTAGEELTIGKDSELFADGKIKLEPAVNTGKISLLNVTRNKGIPAYRGNMELERQGEGILILNEVLLEEYLYAVVPSEMPSSYPLEALKAQAICARTYAYNKMLYAGLPAYGAHVDDSSGFQVYNNIDEQVETSRAVRETKGELLMVGEEPAETFYYSTSCGYGTNTAVWANSVPSEYPYLRSKAVNVAGVTDAQGDTIDEQIREDDIAEAAVIKADSDFSAFIRNKRTSDFESEEAWYRWTYQIQNLNSDILYENLTKRYEANPELVLTGKEDGSFYNTVPENPGRIKNIEIVSRNEGGVAQELLIEGEYASLLVKTEHNIRYVLSDRKTKVVRQDGSEYLASTLLPSAFFDIEPVIQGGYVDGYTLYGGGFGHGVGMSQNGARNMANMGCSDENILEFFYEGSRIKAVY